MSEMQQETAVQREVVMTVLTHLKKGEIQEATACFAESFQFNDWGIGLEFSKRTGWPNSSRRAASFIQILRCRQT